MVLTCRFPHLSSITLSHHGRYAFCATPEADMSVAIHQGKSIYMAGICIDISGEFLHKHFSVLIIIEDRRPVYTPGTSNLGRRDIKNGGTGVVGLSIIMQREKHRPQYLQKISAARYQ
jgi:hypothetical protein